MLAMRGVALSYETVREGCLKFGQTYANDLRRRSSRPGDSVAVKSDQAFLSGLKFRERSWSMVLWPRSLEAFVWSG